MAMPDILVVDDEPMVRELIRLTLEGAAPRLLELVDRLLA